MTTDYCEVTYGDDSTRELSCVTIYPNDSASLHIRFRPDDDESSGLRVRVYKGPDGESVIVYRAGPSGLAGKSLAGFWREELVGVALNYWGGGMTWLEGAGE